MNIVSEKKNSLEKRGQIYVSIGLGFCIASTEALRYTSIWYLGSAGSLWTTSIKVFILLCLFTFLLVLTKSRERPLYKSTALLIVIPILQTFAYIWHYFRFFNIESNVFLHALESTLIESSYFLYIIFVSFFLTLNIKTAVQSLLTGLIVAGTIQICITFVPAVPAFVLILLFTPLSCIFLQAAIRSKQSDEEWIASLPESERRLFEDEQQDSSGSTRPEESEKQTTQLWQLYIAIALLSLIVAAIHSQWLRAQDMNITSAMIQICAGVGTILASNLFLTIRQRLEDRDIVDILRIVILPVAIGTLYIASLTTGSLVALSVIPLNIIYVAVLFLSWIAAFIYRSKQMPLFVCVSAFFAKKIGVVAGLGVIRDLSQEAGPWVVTVFIAVVLLLLVILSTIHFIGSRKATSVKPSAPIAQGADFEVLQSMACTKVGDQYRLTPREKEVLELLVKGRTANYIANTLFISNATAKTHIKHIYQKAGVQSKQALLDLIDTTLLGQ